MSTILYQIIREGSLYHFLTEFEYEVFNYTFKLDFHDHIGILDEK